MQTCRERSASRCFNCVPSLGGKRPSCARGCGRGRGATACGRPPAGAYLGAAYMQAAGPDVYTRTHPLVQSNPFARITAGQFRARRMYQHARTLRKTTAPAMSAAHCSTLGAIWRHGPHLGRRVWREGPRSLGARPGARGEGCCATARPRGRGWQRPRPRRLLGPCTQHRASCCSAVRRVRDRPGAHQGAKKSMTTWDGWARERRSRGTLRLRGSAGCTALPSPAAAAAASPKRPVALECYRMRGSRKHVHGLGAAEARSQKRRGPQRAAARVRARLSSRAQPRGMPPTSLSPASAIAPFSSSRVAH